MHVQIRKNTRLHNFTERNNDTRMDNYFNSYTKYKKTNTRTYTQIQSHKHTSTHTITQTYKHTYSHTNIQAHIQSHKHTSTLTVTQTYKHTYNHTNIQAPIQTPIRRHIHVSIHSGPVYKSAWKGCDGSIEVEEKMKDGWKRSKKKLK